MGTIQQELADEKQKSEESVALVKQKEEDIKVTKLYWVTKVTIFESFSLNFNIKSSPIGN